ncbi:DUF938 domain-containing protein [Aurantiacibacter marinus]|uniref:SAM-dependent methyltransferase n=1 Tax=Aurantiacibacter marinus TaxID=874156 RepID=A0A0H0XKS0_9SPHN|nr:DUF938 domain-containing protein [Aurantiacibacter marinus]KLI63218.1 SAM-dependent methyltransferase [Aurantiacibacter marinus]
MKRFAPATERNRDAIAAVLADELPALGKVLEVASGSGEHAVHFAGRFPALEWQPSDPDPEAVASIAAWRAEAGLANLRKPFMLDAAAANWPVMGADALLCVNMVHISPPAASEGLFAGAGRILPVGAPLLLYGPYLEEGVETAASNLTFDASLKARDPRWGLRDTAWVDKLATTNFFDRVRRVAMPANNIMLIYRHK